MSAIMPRMTTTSTQNGSATASSTRVVVDFLEALAAADLPRAMELLTEDAVWINVSLPAVRGRRRIRRLMELGYQRGARFRVHFHNVATDHGVVLTERTDAIGLGRFEQRTPEHTQWPPWSLERASALATSSAAGLHSLATAAGSEGLSATITYRNRAGVEARNSLWEILMHIVMHGTYHRGQIALLARDGGGVPASTDFSTYLRERSE